MDNKFSVPFGITFWFWFTLIDCFLPNNDCEGGPTLKQTNICVYSHIHRVGYIFIIWTAILGTKKTMKVRNRHYTRTFSWEVSWREESYFHCVMRGVVVTRKVKLRAQSHILTRTTTPLTSSLVCLVRLFVYCHTDSIVCCPLIRPDFLRAGCGSRSGRSYTNILTRSLYLLHYIDHV